MEGPDFARRDPTSQAKSSEIENARMVVGNSPINEWTDAKHNLYLSSIEATFVNQLYGTEHLSSDLLWLSRAQKKANPSGSCTNKPQSGQFKVMRRGCWGALKFERTKRRDAKVNMDNDDLLSQSVYLNSHMEVIKPSSRQLPDCYPLMYPQGSVSTQAEVSDQNFDNTEHKLRKEASKARGKKRFGQTDDSENIDQLVPFNFLKVEDAEICSIIEQQDIDGNSFEELK